MEGLFNFELDLMDKLSRVLPEFIKQLALLLSFTLPPIGRYASKTI